MFSPVPWFVAGGKHEPEVARLLAYAATGGGEGVVQATDCKVEQLDVPATSVRVLPGAVVVRNGAAGAGSQTYLARNAEAQVVTMTATGSGGPRTDLIVARIEDPQYPGTADPADPENGPYVFVRVVADVPADTTRVQEIAGHENDSAVTLARVTRPASTGTVLNSHITDLRTLAQPRTGHETRIANPAAADLQNTTATAGEVWPDEASWSIHVPVWATTVRLVGTWAQVLVPAGDAKGLLWIVLGDTEEVPAPTQKVRYDTSTSGGATRQTYVCADEIPVPEAMRGKTVTVRLRAVKSSGSAAGRITADTGSAIALTADFIENPA